ncbi:MAG: DUF6327 family protein [Bacteroidota bacterium]
MKKYSSFDEINRDLKLLKLQTQISKQKANIEFAHIKNDLTISNLIAELISIFGKKMFYEKIGKKLMRKFKL